MKITVETLWPKLLPLVRLMNTDSSVANAIRIPKGYGTLRQNQYSGFKNWVAIQNFIQNEMEKWRGLNWEYPEITEFFERYKQD